VKRHSSKHRPSSKKKRFALACVVGPMEDRRTAERFANAWSVSRGIQPRAVFAGLLAQKLNFQIAVNVDVLFDAEGRGITVDTLKRDENGMLLRFLLNNTQENSTEALSTD